MVLQIGGWTSGGTSPPVSTYRRLHQNQVFGLTVPLITKADGTKLVKPKARSLVGSQKTSP
ncbi:hypothetical protein ACNKHW_10230 [Shigella flexneri]